ncbi:bifunctional methylenetetrahydrofolate dehydrogenase/methenyltetrahydrofolate cyclohydrolase FolD [bacterium]|nr:bifunctional methylenetetrahydrofolate dehydrogenase/methenyltetrahydrofolate cyclohydrolase FolD [bacterium]
MTARWIDGKAIADEIRLEIAHRVKEFVSQTKYKPHLAAVLVGENPASEVYIKNKRLACEKVGMESTLHLLPADIRMPALLDVIASLNRDPTVHGILVQFPLPGELDEGTVVHAIDPAKDVDAFHPLTVGLLVEGKPRFLPCTPEGVHQLLLRSGIEIPHKHVVVVGRSSLVGRPLSIMLSQKGPHADATVTLCHSRTKDLAYHCKQADILVAALGRPEAITANMVRPGAVVIDVGIHRTSAGKLIGDVAFDEVARVASAITPVPGGVGPMTVTMLLENTLRAAIFQRQA